MRKVFSLLFTTTLFTGFIFMACEKDDICSEGTPTTPKVVINFKEYLNPSIEKPFLKLEISEIDNPERVLVYNNVSSIKLPLKTNDLQSKYIFRLTYNSINQEIVNEDYLEFNYSKKDIYISRACGYKSEFLLTPSSSEEQNPEVSDINEDGLWIKEINVLSTQIKNENETHLEILY